MWRLEDTRVRTLATLADVRDPWFDRLPHTGRNSIGTLLYHVAAIELDWVFDDVLGADFPDGFRDWFPLEVRDGEGRISRFEGESLDGHRRRLAWVRDHCIGRMSTLDDDAFVAAREGSTVTGSWVVHHLTQHEAEHRGQIQALVTSFGGAEPA